MTRPIRLSLFLLVPALAAALFSLMNRKAFPSDTTPEGAYARIVLAVTQGKPRDSFAYLETQAQWAVHTIHDYRKQARDRIAQAYPEPDKSVALADNRQIAEAGDAADVWARLAETHGFLARLRKDLSGIRSIEISGERATVETARGTRYTFRRRENGIWGLTMFTAELLADSEKAARDLQIVRKSAEDYERASKL